MVTLKDKYFSFREENVFVVKVSYHYIPGIVQVLRESMENNLIPNKSCSFLPLMIRYVETYSFLVRVYRFGVLSDAPTKNIHTYHKEMFCVIPVSASWTQEHVQVYIHMHAFTCL